MKYLLLLALFVGCTKVNKKSEFVDLVFKLNATNYCHMKGTAYSIEETDKVNVFKCVKSSAKYRTPNILTMIDGCMVRVDEVSAEHFLIIVNPLGIAQIGNTEPEAYFRGEGLNDWSEKCSKPKYKYYEHEVLKAKYKKEYR